jgi:uncharacterized membrane protein YqjE
MPPEASAERPVADDDYAVRAAGSLESLSALQRELRSLVHDQLQLAALEVRLAAHSLMAMLAAAIFAGLLLLFAWVALMGATGFGLADMGLHPTLAWLAVAALTLVLALLLGGFIRRRSRRLGFPASLRTLQPPASDPRQREAT